MKRLTTNDRGQVGIGTLIVFIALVLVAAIAAGVIINTAGLLQTQAEETGQDSSEQVADNLNIIGEVGEVTNESDMSGLGDLEEGDQVVYETRLTVQRSPGGGDIDLTGLSIQWVGDNGFAQLVHASDTIDNDTPDPENVYFIQDVTAVSSDDAVLTDDGDRYEIVIPTGLEIELDDSDEADTINATLNGDGKEIFEDDEGDIYDDEETDVEVDFDDFDGETIDNSALDVLLAGEQTTLEITTDSGASRNTAISVPDTLLGEDGGTVTL